MSEKEKLREQEEEIARLNAIIDRMAEDISKFWECDRNVWAYYGPEECNDDCITCIKQHFGV